jgi:hypothetical protein
MEVFFTVLVKGPEQYIVVWDDSSRGEAARVLCRWASAPQLSFNWQDAAMVAEHLRAEAGSWPDRLKFAN